MKTCHEDLLCSLLCKTPCLIRSALAQFAVSALLLSLSACSCDDDQTSCSDLPISRTWIIIEKPPKSIVLDFDGTDDRDFGNQEGRGYSSHQGGYAFLPLYVYCGNHLLVSYPRQVNRTNACHSAAILLLLVKGIRAHWPKVNIVFRGDAGFYRPLLLSWCERHDVRYIIGYGSIEILLRECRVGIETLECAWHWLEHYDSDIPSIKHFQDIDYQARSWRKSRRVVARIERNSISPNQRFIVTDLPGDAEQLYSEVYCERGTMGNRH